MQGCFLSEEPTTRRVDQPERLGFFVVVGEFLLARDLVEEGLHADREEDKLLDGEEVSLMRV